MKVVRSNKVVDAWQWFKNGDIPGEVNEVFTEGPFEGQYLEGTVVRYYRHPNDPSDRVCGLCNKTMHEHGWIENDRNGITVCPSDIIIRLDDDKYVVTNEKEFKADYVIVDNKSPIFNVNFQDRAYDFFLECFSEEFPELIHDKTENQHRFVEESLEFVQSLGMTKEEVLALVDYVFSRPIGDSFIEAGGVSTTYSILCKTHGINVIEASEAELIRNYKIINKIRQKQRIKNELGIKPHRVYRLKDMQ